MTKSQLINRHPKKFREAIYAYGLGFIGWHYWGWIGGEWEEPESNDPTASYAFTGAFSEKEEEVYEGDIIAYGGDNHNGVVVFGEYEGAIGFYTEEGARLRGTDKKKREHGLPPTTSPIEIIGNIIENPRLARCWGRSFPK